jgi:hypothetical protein
MAFNTELITSTEVKSLAGLFNSFDSSYFNKYIISTQTKYLRNAIGKEYYDELQTEFDSTSGYSVDNSSLVENYVKPMLAHFVVYEVYDKIHNQLTNQGVMNNDTEFSRQGGSFEYSQSKNFYISQGEELREQMIQYIKDERETDSDKYPLFTKAGKQQMNKRGWIF